MAPLRGGLSGYLVENGIAFNGVVLLSTVLNFETILFTHGNDPALHVVSAQLRGHGFLSQKLPPDLPRKSR
jgi:hypothetical protein